MNLVHRKLYRLSGLIFPFIYWFTNKKFILISLAVITTLVLLTEAFRFYFPTFNQELFRHFGLILKERERRNISGTTYFLIGFFLTIFLFEKDIAIVALIFAVFGDAIAAIAGETFGRTRIGNKSLEGCIACFILCFFIGLILIYTGLNFDIKSVFFGALAATIIEVLPVGIDDNLTLPIFTGFIMEGVRFLAQG